MATYIKVRNGFTGVNSGGHHLHELVRGDTITSTTKEHRRERSNQASEEQCDYVCIRRQRRVAFQHNNQALTESASVSQIIEAPYESYAYQQRTQGLAALRTSTKAPPYTSA